MERQIASVGYCGVDFCHRRATEICSICHDLRVPPGRKILFMRPDQEICFCVCAGGPGVQSGTLVATPAGPIRVDDVVAGQTRVLAAGTALRFAERVVGYRNAVQRVEVYDAVVVTYRAGTDSRNLVLTSMREVLLHPSRQLCPAGGLTPEDHLCDARGGAVEILDVRIGSFTGPFVDVAVSIARPGPSYDDHLLVLNDVVVGDLTTEIYPSTGLDARPIVGSPEWRAAFRHAGAAADEAAISIGGGVFKPASAHRIQIPQHASD